MKAFNLKSMKEDMTQMQAFLESEISYETIVGNKIKNKTAKAKTKADEMKQVVATVETAQEKAIAALKKVG